MFRGSLFEAYEAWKNSEVDDVAPSGNPGGRPKVNEPQDIYKWSFPRFA